MRGVPRAASVWRSEPGAGLPGRPRHTVLGRLVRSADFERVLRNAPRAKSAHFAIHHLGGRPSPVSKGSKVAVGEKLSTGDVPTPGVTVDDSPQMALPAGARWLGTVVPKRHARRSVTRSLLKRQMRSAVADDGEYLPPGLWVIRLRAPFDPKAFASAASNALRLAARQELGKLVERAAVSRGG